MPALFIKQLGKSVPGIVYRGGFVQSSQGDGGGGLGEGEGRGSDGDGGEGGSEGGEGGGGGSGEHAPKGSQSEP